MRKKRYSYNVGMLLNQVMYQRLRSMTDKRKVIMSEQMQKLGEEKISQKKETKNE